jgi:hypothetical protein
MLLSVSECLKGGISAPTPEASSRKNPAQEIRCQRQGTRQRKAQDKFSCRHALRNHTKKTITAISTDVNKAGPAQGYLVVPPSCVLPSSAFMPSASRICLANLQDQEVQDHADEEDIHQHSGKNDTVGEIFFVQVFHSGRAYPICPCNRKACGYISPVLPLHPQSGSSPNGASMPIC